MKNGFQYKSASNNVAATKKQSPFIESIEVKPDASVTEQTEPVALTSDSQIKPANDPVTIKSDVNNNGAVFQTKTTAVNLTTSSSSGGSSLEQFSAVQFKYAIKMDVPVENLQNKTLYETISNWWGTPYRMGGTTHRGIDCSAFVQTLMLGVFSIQLPRTAREQKKVTSWVSKDSLKEGDLVFFNTRGGVSHVGVYLQNNKFVHASSSKGVMISDLKEAYWSKKIIGGGRVLNHINPKP